jgi:alpha-tubulin suppressor-like RCC1 family protein
VPTTITGLSGVRQLVAGRSHTLALLEDGTVKAWGLNTSGQLGLGTTTNWSTPIAIANLSGVREVIAGEYHSLALLDNGTVKAWGQNNYGQLGLGNTAGPKVPTIITGLSSVRQLVSGGIHTLALLEDGTVKVWGGNSYGQLGLENINMQISPMTIMNLSGVRQLLAGQSHTLALMKDGTLKAWGNNFSGQLGLGDETNRSTPTSIGSLGSVRQLAVGQNYSLALLENGTVKAWGDNSIGQLGLGNTNTQRMPTTIAGLSGVKQLSAGVNYSLALMEDGTVKAWGDNSYGQLGLGNTTARSIPTTITGLNDVKQLSAGTNHTLALMGDGTVKAWGDNIFGQLGLGNMTSQNTPTTITGLIGVKQLTAGLEHTFALLEDGTVKGWGSDIFGQLGLGNGGTYNTPTTITGLSSVRQLATGLEHTLALLQDGTVKAWGYNDYGQLGLGNTIPQISPKTISGLSDVRELIAGEYHSGAIMENGTVKMWGNNMYGQLGLGNRDNQYTPTISTALKGVHQLAAGVSHTLALLEGGMVKAWGNNEYGQLGGEANRFLTFSSLTYQPRLYVSGREGTGIRIKYYVDAETTPREVKDISLTFAGASLSFDAFDARDMSNGVHTLRIEASDGNQTVQKSVSFTVANAPTANTYSATSTINSITAKVTSTDTSLAALPFRFSINQTTSAWLANQSGASYPFNTLAINEKYPVTFEVKDLSGMVTTETIAYYTLAEKPSLTRTGTKPDRVSFNVTDNNPVHTQYQVIVGNRSVDENGVLVAEPVWITLLDKSFVIKGLSSSNSYQVKIKARNQEGIETEESAAVQVGTPVKPPAIPQQIKTEATTNKITLSWNPVPDATGYEVERNGTSVVSAGAATTYAHTGLASNSKQMYRVRAVKSGVYGEWSNPVQAMTLLPSPVVPNNVTALATSKTVTLSWNQVATALWYEVEWDGRILNVGPQTTFKQIGLQPGSQHVYRVRAVNGAGAGVWSTQAAILTQTTPPTAITSLTGEASDKSVSLRWLPIDDASYYEIEADGQLFQNGISFFAELKGLIPGTAHQYRVRAVNEYGTGPWSSILALTTNKLPTPLQLKDKPEDKSIALTWDAVPQATSYQVEADGQMQTVTTPSFTHNSLTPETTHTYRVRATGTEGMSGWSATLTVKTLPLKPAAPTTVNALAGKDYVTLTWNPVSGATAYEVEIDGKVVIDNFNETKYTDTLLDPFTSHTYRVRSKTDAVEGDWALPVSIQTLPDRPVAPAGIVVSSSGNIVTLKWDADPSALGYDLEVNGQLVNNGLNTEYKHRRVSVGSEHKYRVRIRNQAGIGDWSGLIINNNMTAKLSKGKTVNLGLTGSNVTDFSRYTLTVTYDPNAMSVVDLSTLTGAPEVTTGRIEGTDITITAFRPGQIVFVTDRVVKPGETWTGVINSIKFMASVSGGSALTYSVIQN